MIPRRSRQSLGQALAFALEGLRHAVRTQRAFRIQLVITGFVGGLLLWLGVPALESGVIILSILVVLVVELINTALEVVVDLLVGAAVLWLTQKPTGAARSVSNRPR